MISAALVIGGGAALPDQFAGESHPWEDHDMLFEYVKHLSVRKITPEGPFSAARKYMITIRTQELVQHPIARQKIFCVF